jgi:hypothetical protein
MTVKEPKNIGEDSRKDIESYQRMGYLSYKRCNWCNKVRDFWNIMTIFQQWDNKFVKVFCSTPCLIKYYLTNSHEEVMGEVVDWLKTTDVLE